MSNAKAGSSNDANDDDEASDVVDENEDPESIRMTHDAKFDFLEEGTYVALYSAEQFNDPFYILRLNAKDIAREIRTDYNGHSVLCNEKYFIGNYLQKEKESRKGITYKIIKKYVFQAL